MVKKSVVGFFLLFSLWGCIPWKNLWIRYQKEKASVYIEKPKEPVVLLTGFHSVPFREEDVWIYAGLSNIVPNFLRLSGKYAFLDNESLTVLMPGLTMYQFFEPAPEKELDELCQLLQCDRWIYVYFTGEGEAITAIIRDKQKGKIDEEEVVGTRKDLTEFSRELMERLLERLEIERNISPWIWRRFIPSHAEAFRPAMMGLLYLTLGWYYLSEEYLKEALRKDENFSTGYSLLAEIYLAKDRVDEVPPLLEKILARDTDNYFQWYLLGIAYDYLGQKERAIESLKRSLAINPNFGEASSLLAILYSQQGREEERWKALSQFLRSNPYTGGQIRAAQRYVRQFAGDPVTRLVKGKLVRHQVETDVLTSEQRKLYESLEYLDSWSTASFNIFQPHLLVVSPKKTLWVFGEEGKAAELSLNGEILRQVQWKEIISPSGVTWDHNGVMYIADELGDAIYQIVQNNPKLWSSEVRSPKGICMYQNEFYTVQERDDRLVVLNSRGKVKQFYRLPVRLTTKRNRYGALVCRNGTLYIPATLSNYIYVLNTNGEKLREIGGYGSGPGEFAALVSLFEDEEGNLYTTEHYVHRIQILDARGYPRAMKGKLGELPGEFQKPSGIVAIEGRKFSDGATRVYVADTDGNRIQVFRWKR
ncbi:MAG: tetratricopeptide repeat protein [bacterium JZ-2024 1]